MTLALIFAAVVGLLAALTAVGQRRRGHGPVTAIVAGLVFPVTWTVWYVRDERPYRLAHRH